ncbi:sugar transferase [Nonomuraea longispora]|uniref:Sugar transferase n=1 Tax=Nonomuraea longispora TaxID=1848320 RepID=A0A4R4NN41_9ACTN|nr:sugar transferase [Nonomuraea longispora]TDC09240.1 sugar transferase [Nonomuraea longispora]
MGFCTRIAPFGDSRTLLTVFLTRSTRSSVKLAGVATMPETAFSAKLWMGAGGGVHDAARALRVGVDEFCDAMGERPFGSDDLGRALYEGDRARKAPGFVGLRDALLENLVGTVNLLQGMSAGMVNAGTVYRSANSATMDVLDGRESSQPSSSAALAEIEEYRPVIDGGRLPSTVEPPGFVQQAAWFLQAMGFGCAYPDGDIAQVNVLREAALTIGRVVDRAAEEVDQHAGRVIASGHGPNTDEFKNAVKMLTGEKGLLKELKRQTDELADYCRTGMDAISKAQWHYWVAAAFVVTLVYVAIVINPYLNAAAARLIRLEGMALQITLRIIREAVLGMAFAGGLNMIDQLFATGDIDLKQLLQSTWHGAVAGGLMAGAHGALPSLLRKGGPLLTGLASAMEKPGWERVLSRLLVGGTVSTGVMATAGWASGYGWDWKHAAQVGFGMALLGTGAELAGKTFAAGRQRVSPELGLRLPWEAFPKKGLQWLGSPEKRWMEFKWSMAFMPLAAPVAGLTAVVKFAEDGKSPFMTQPRLGKDGKVFNMWKFRSMKSADGMDSSHGAGDVRVTRFGKVMRAAGWDELPQVAQVAAGKMSWIAHRPLVEATHREMERDLSPPAYQKWTTGKYAVNPGMGSHFGYYKEFFGYEAASPEFNKLREKLDNWHFAHASESIDRAHFAKEFKKMMRAWGSAVTGGKD